MRIATWKVERLRHHRDLTEIIEACKQERADILILTETDSRMEPDYPFAYRTPSFAEILSSYYKPTENRVSIFTRYVFNEVGNPIHLLEHREVQYSE